MANMTFSELNDANTRRLKEFGHGCMDWSETDWACAVAGEVGEMCNAIKKRRRGDQVSPTDVGKEMADVVIYLDLLATRMNLDLGTLVRLKFNEVTERRGLSVRLDEAVPS